MDVPGNIVGSVIGLTVADMTASLKFWNDMLGWEFGPPGDGYTKLQAPEAALMGVPVGTEVRVKTVTIPGSNARMELTEFRGQKLVNQDMRVPDPGASGMAIRVGEHPGAAAEAEGGRRPRDLQGPGARRVGREDAQRVRQGSQRPADRNRWHGRAASAVTG